MKVSFIRKNRITKEYYKLLSLHNASCVLDKFSMHNLQHEAISNTSQFI